MPLQQRGLPEAPHPLLGLGTRRKRRPIIDGEVLEHMSKRYLDRAVAEL
jgi:hypothetical protein